MCRLVGMLLLGSSAFGVSERVCRSKTTPRGLQKSYQEIPNWGIITARVTDRVPAAGYYSCFAVITPYVISTIQYLKTSNSRPDGKGCLPSRVSLFAG
jgi:hypothetical protein